MAVVLVQNVVSDTSEQIEGSSARKTAAQVAAAAIESEAKTCVSTVEPQRCVDWATWARHFTEKCARLEITYGDVPGLKVDTNFVHNPSMTNEPGDSGNTISDGFTGNPPAKVTTSPTANNALAGCSVT